MPPARRDSLTRAIRWAIRQVVRVFKNPHPHPHAAPSPVCLTLGASIPGKQLLSLATPELVASHKHVMGVSGSGKSRFLASLAVQLLNQGIAFALLDPHGDLGRDILGMLYETGFFNDPKAFDRLWYIDMTRGDAFIAYNVLKQDYLSPHAVAAMILEVCKRAWSTIASGNTPALENILLSSVTVLVENGLPLTALSKLLADQAYRDQLLQQVSDQQIIEFFHDRFDALGKRSTVSSESTLRRAFLLTFSPALRMSLGQKENKLNFRTIMDRQVSCIFNLGGLDPHTQRFLGNLLSVGLETAALSRAEITDATQRKPYHFIIDEFSQFSAQSEDGLQRILDLTRKYGMSLTLAHQTWSQVSKQIAGALQNCIHLLFQLGYEDSAWAAPRFMEHNPYKVKHEVAKWPWEAEYGHPLYFTEAETTAQWRTVFETLKRQEAIVRIGKRTSKIKSLTFPDPKITPAQLAALESEYAKRLLTPLSQIMLEEPIPEPDPTPLPVVQNEHPPVPPAPAQKQARRPPKRAQT